jgi:hypothetical protein
MAFSSNVKDCVRTVEGIANLLNSNVKSNQTFTYNLIEEIGVVARLRRARRIYQKTVADKVLVLTQLERKFGVSTSPLEEQATTTLDDLRSTILNLGYDSTLATADYGHKIMSELEKIVFLIESLRNQGTWTGVAATVMLYLRTQCSESLFLVLKELFDQYFDNDPRFYNAMEEHALDEVDDEAPPDLAPIEDDDVPAVRKIKQKLSNKANWMDIFKTATSNWKLAINNEGFSHVSRLISMLVGVGMIQATSLQCEVAGIKLFSGLCVPKVVGAFDLLDACMNCIIFFVEGGYECIQTGSIKPLLFGEKDFSAFDDDFIECKRLFDYAQPGNYHMIDADENSVVKFITVTIEEGKRLSQITRNPFSKKMILDRIMRMQEWLSVLEQHRLNAGVRMKPFCAVSYGSTGVGKSTIAPLLMYHILEPNGYDSSDKSCVMLKAGEKFEENVRSYINGGYYDDFGNTKPEFTQESPVESFRDTVNTACTTARMADLALKNKVAKLFKGVVVSTNVKDLNATKYSEEPASITRRADVFLTFRVRKQFETLGMLDSKKVEEHYNGDVPLIPDLWEIDMEVSCPLPNPTPGRCAVVGFKTIVWNGRPLKNVDMQTALQYIVSASRHHFAMQKIMIERSTGLKGKIECCPTCKSSVETCICGITHVVSYAEPTFTPAPSQAKRPTYPNQRKEANLKRDDEQPFSKPKASGKILNYLLPEKKPDPLEEQAAMEVILQHAEYLQNLCRYQFRWAVPRRWIRSYAILRVVRQIIMRPRLVYALAAGVLLPLCISNKAFMFSALFGYLYFLYVIFLSYVYIVETNVANQVQARWHHTKHMATRTAYILGTGLAIKCIYDMARKYVSLRTLRTPLVEHSYLNPTDKDIKERDANDLTPVIAEEQNWANVAIAPLPSSEQSKTITEDDLMELCRTNTACVVVNDKVVTNLFFVCSNVAFIPTHLIKKWQDKLCYIVRSDVGTIGGNFKTYLSYSHSAQIPNTDLSIVWLPNGGSWKDLTKYFPTEIVKKDCGVRICDRDVLGRINNHRTFARQGTQQLKSCQAFGYSYSINSFVGMCGSPVMSQTIAPMIIGVHVAGVVADKMGFASAIAQSDIKYALELLMEKPSILLAHSDGTIPFNLYDVKILEEQSIHFKSPVNRLVVDDTTPNMKVYGSCQGRATYYSKVKPSIISPIVEKVTGVKQQWGAPKFHKGNAWQESLTYSSKPSYGVEPSLLDKSVVDYLCPIFRLLDGRPALRATARPLTKMQIVCGIDGVKFIDKMDPNTSCGFALPGPKINHIIYFDPADYEGVQCPADLEQFIWDEYGIAIQAWKVGERYHAIFKGCLKDEPTPLDKDKVRVFQAAPIVLQIGVRKYFLPIVRLISLFPALTECAVGLNCVGPDWEEFQAHISKFGKDRILAGDYSKYDLRMPAQITFAAFKVLISIAKYCGYSEEDLTIMRGIATDICYPTIAFNGDLLQFIGSNPSGHNLTVYINSIGNSLLFRCAFFSMVKGHTFRSVCALGTYGDDAKSSVKEGFDQFNHISVANFFAERDMKFTMPDKTSTPTPYMKDEDADFLKRMNNYIPELGRHVGALDENSIFKSLHANLMKKRALAKELAAQNIDGAIRDWFFHGREVFEKRVAQMKQVAEEAEIDHMCHMLNETFDSRVKAWFDRYEPEDMESL